MDKKSLSYHEKVQDWTQLYRLTADGKIYKDTKEITYLTPQKIQEIDSWRNNVRKKMSKNKITNGPSNNNPKRTRSAKQLCKGTTQLRDRANSAGGRHTLTGTDIYSVSNHLAETSLHYSAMREDIYRANKNGSIHNPTKAILNGTAAEVPKKIDKVIQFQNSVDRTKCSSQSSKADDDIVSQSSSETISLASTSRMTDRGKMIQVKDTTMISVRSASNHLLNVISIDDCKMAIQRPLAYSAHSVVKETGRNKSQLSEYKTISIASNSVDIQKQENRSQTMESGKTTTYYPSTVESGISNRPTKTDRKMRVNKAIDTMINDRKVMNNMDRNFDARIAPAGRLVLEKNEGGHMFKRLHSALRKHVDNILSVQANRRHRKHMNGLDDQFSSYIQQIASSMQKGENNVEGDPDCSNSRDTYRSESKRQSHIEQLPIFEEEEENEHDNKINGNKYGDIQNSSNIYEQDDKPDLLHAQLSEKQDESVLTVENVTTQNGLESENETDGNSSGYQCSSSTSSISINNFSEKSMT